MDRPGPAFNDLLFVCICPSPSPNGGASEMNNSSDAIETGFVKGSARRIPGERSHILRFMTSQVTDFYLSLLQQLRQPRPNEPGTTCNQNFFWHLVSFDTVK